MQFLFCLKWMKIFELLMLSKLEYWLDLEIFLSN